MVDYGFPWDTSTGLPGRRSGFSGLATTIASILKQTLWLSVPHYCFGSEDCLHNHVSFICLPVHYFLYDIQQKQKSICIKLDLSQMLLVISSLLVVVDRASMVCSLCSLCVSKVWYTIIQNHEPLDPKVIPLNGIIAFMRQSKYLTQTLNSNSN